MSAQPGTDEGTDAGEAVRAGAHPGAHRLVRDLAWLLLSPPLLDPAYPAFAGLIQVFSADERERIAAWLRELERDPGALERMIAAAQPPVFPLRLGRYAERLLEFYLRAGPTHRLEAVNIPLRHSDDERAALSTNGDHTTRGEIDYLLRDAAGQPWHWELAVKFFLCTAEGERATAEHFVGPDRAETLPTKLHKLFERQLKHRPPPPWDAVAWRHAAFTRGWMFYRWGCPVPRCELLAPDHLRGHWIEHGQMHRLPEGRYAGIPRSQWMAFAQLDSERALRSRDEMAAHIAHHWAQPAPHGAKRWPTAQLIARVERHEDGWSEAERMFVVPDGWAAVAPC